MLKNITSKLNLSQNDIFVDIGGGNGKYTSMVLRHTKLFSEPICVEPSELANIAKNNDTTVVYNEDALTFTERGRSGSERNETNCRDV